MKPQLKNSPMTDEILFYKGVRKMWNGRMMEKSPNHPYRIGKTAKVLEHRRIVERYLGRFLDPDEIIHHCDGNPLNNNIDNLELITEKEHNRIHNPKRENKFSEKEVIEALKKHKYNVEKTAKYLNVYYQYFYTHYDHLLKKRNSPGFLESKKQEICKSCQEVGIVKTAKIFGTNIPCLLHNLDLWEKKQEIPLNFVNSVRRKKKSGEIDRIFDKLCNRAKQIGATHAALEFGVIPNSFHGAILRKLKVGEITLEFANQLKKH